MKQSCTLKIELEELDVEYILNKAEPNSGYPENIELESVRYNGTELIYLINCIPGAEKYIIEEVWNYRDGKKNKYRNKTIEIMHKLVMPYNPYNTR